MPKYLVPFEGCLLVEAASWQQAEIMSLTWRQSLLRLKAGEKPVKNTMHLRLSLDKLVEVETAEVQAVNIAFGVPPFTDITTQVEAHREEAVEKERQYRLGKGLPETDLMDEQLVLFTLGQ